MWSDWQGSMMSHAGRDPLFWATMAVSEQDFGGSGDLCLRCHTPKGWIEGFSTPTDGSALDPDAHADGIECHYCHRMTNPDDSEWAGVQTGDFIANDGGNPPTGYYGSAMGVLAASGVYGPYAGLTNPGSHGGSTNQSAFHRSAQFCGTCHDVSNPAVGNLAHNFGAQPTADPVVADGALDGALTDKAAFNNFPFQYGIVERTYSEHQAGLLSQTRVGDYAGLPDALKAEGGAIRLAYEAAVAADPSGDYVDETPRYFSCQSCHMMPVTGKGADRNQALTHTDLPKHDLTGGNYWAAEAIKYLDAEGKLPLGGGLSDTQKAAMLDGEDRARAQLESAAALQLDGNLLKVINLTGHKLISGYPEGRRMWLNVRWFDDAEPANLLREDGAYGPLFDPQGGPVQVEHPKTQQLVQVESLAALHDPYVPVYEAHYGLTQEWATQLCGLGLDRSKALKYNRYSGQPKMTLGELCDQPPGSSGESFRFVLNNAVLGDNRIPPYGMTYDAAREHNVLPVPADQYGGNGSGTTYRHWDEVTLVPPLGAEHAEVTLKYQPTSWEHIQFLALANDGSEPTLADAGRDLLEAWLETGMAAPHSMTSVSWEQADHCNGNSDGVADLTGWDFDEDAECTASQSIEAANMRVQQDATVGLHAPQVAFGSNLTIAAGGTLRIDAEVTASQVVAER
jgi:hypothetical protein